MDKNKWIEEKLREELDYVLSQIDPIRWNIGEISEYKKDVLKDDIIPLFNKFKDKVYE